MAVPKKRKGHSAQGHKRAQWKATVPTLSKCKNCGESKLAHHICDYCGFYGNKFASKKLEEV